MSLIPKKRFKKIRSSTHWWCGVTCVTFLKYFFNGKGPYNNHPYTIIYHETCNLSRSRVAWDLVLHTERARRSDNDLAVGKRNKMLGNSWEISFFSFGYRRALFVNICFWDNCCYHIFICYLLLIWVDVKRIVRTLRDLII